ncbi:MAG: VOC family protein [Pirellulaceae bacterium]|nr:VOC family protein [Planctomycetales bacterium]
MAIKTRQLNHVAIHVANVEVSQQFYENVLLLETISRPAFTFPGAWYRLGSDQELHLIGDRHQPVHSDSRGNHYALLVDDIDAWEEHLRSTQTPYKPRRTRPDGAFQIYVSDPDGHTIELCTSPPREPAVA